jgi:hypothetical protein
MQFTKNESAGRDHLSGPEFNIRDDKGVILSFVFKTKEERDQAHDQLRAIVKNAISVTCVR